MVDRFEKSNDPRSYVVKDLDKFKSPSDDERLGS